MGMLKFKFSTPIHTYHALVIKPEWPYKLSVFKINLCNTLVGTYLVD